MKSIPDDIFTEPGRRRSRHPEKSWAPRAMAGIFEGQAGTRRQPPRPKGRAPGVIERYELQPIDPQANGPQLTTACATARASSSRERSRRFTIRSVLALGACERHGDPDTRDSRAQVAMAVGNGGSDAKSFKLSAKRGSTSFGICSAGFPRAGVYDDGLPHPGHDRRPNTCPTNRRDMLVHGQKSVWRTRIAIRSPESGRRHRIRRHSRTNVPASRRSAQRPHERSCPASRSIAEVRLAALPRWAG